MQLFFALYLFAQADAALGAIDIGEVVEIKQAQARNGHGFDIKVRCS